MKKFLTLVSLLMFSLPATAQVQTANQVQSFTTTTSSGNVGLSGTNTQFHTIQWWGFGTLSTCTVKLEQSATGAGGSWSDLILAQNCTSNGLSTIPGTPNFVRITVTDISGGGRVDVRYTGYNSTPLLTSTAGYTTVEDEGIAQTQRTTINFTGAGVTCTDSGGLTACDITAGGGGGTPGGANTQIQYNNTGAFGGVSKWTTNGTTTLTGLATAILDLTAASKFYTPKSAGCATAADGQLCYDITSAQYKIYQNSADRYVLTGSSVGSSDGQIPIWNNTTKTFVPGDPLVQGLTAHDAVGTSTNPVLTGGYASGTMPAAVSADGDAVRSWYLLNGQQVTVVGDGAGNIADIATGTFDALAVTTVDASGARVTPLTDTALRATPVPVSGTVTVTDGAGSLNTIVDSGHIIIDSGSTTAVTGNVATTVADGANVTLGAKADAKSTATDTTAITVMSVLKEISAMEQAPASRAVTNAGTFAVQAAIADGADVTLGAKADAKSTATDTTAITVMQVLKEISAMEQAPASRAVTNAGTFAVQAAQSGNWSVRAQDGAGNALTSNSTTYTAKFGLDSNILGTLGTAFTTPGFVDIKGADGNVFVRQTTAANLNATVVGTGTFQVQCSSGCSGGTLSNNNAAPTNNNGGVLAAVANAVSPTYGEGNQVLLSTDLTGALRVSGSSGGGIAQNQVRDTNNAWADVGYYPGDQKLPVYDQGVERLLLQVSQALQTGTLKAGLFNRPIDRGNPLPVVTSNLGNPCVNQVPGEVAISQTADATVITGQPGMRVLICQVRIVVGAAEITNEAEGTGTTCATGKVMHSGSSTDANGESFAANGGYVSVSPFYLLPGNNFCIEQSGSNRVAGKVSFLYVP